MDLGFRLLVPSCDVQRVATVQPPSQIAGARGLSSVLADISHRKIRAIGMMEDKRAHARLWIHHEAFRELNADLFRLQQFPESRLIFQIRACRISKAVAFPTVARSKSLRHGQLRRIGESPILANAPV